MANKQISKLYYGGGQVSVTGNVRGLQLSYSGAIEIEDKTSSNFVITQQKNRIMIFPLGDGLLNKLFEYEGELIVLTVLACNEQGEKEYCAIKRDMHYSELLGKSEDLTLKSEDMNKGYLHSKIINKTSLNQPILKNLHTSNDNYIFYLKTGIQYSGSYHIHLINNTVMTGAEHGKTSEVLYIMSNDKLITTRNMINRKY